MTFKVVMHVSCSAALLLSCSAMAGFINPMDFDGSALQKQEVIHYIQQRVHKDYCESQVEMCLPTTLKMMENENFTAFKQATQATNRAVMDSVIHAYCHGGIDMCTYQTIWMMYKQNSAAMKWHVHW